MNTLHQARKKQKGFRGESARRRGCPSSLPCLPRLEPHVDVRGRLCCQLAELVPEIENKYLLLAIVQAMIHAQKTFNQFDFFINMPPCQSDSI